MQSCRYSHLENGAISLWNTMSGMKRDGGSVQLYDQIRRRDYN